MIPRRRHDLLVSILGLLLLAFTGGVTPSGGIRAAELEVDLPDPRSGIRGNPEERGAS